MDKLKSWMACPPTKGLDLDDPSTTQLRRQIIRRKSFLRQIYREWYRVLVEALPVGQGLTLELGSGAGFLDEMLPGVITTELFYCPGIRAVLDAQRLPWANESLRAIVMVNVLHHIPRPPDFFAEATRCVRTEGAISLAVGDKVVALGLHAFASRTVSSGRARMGISLDGTIIRRKWRAGMDDLWTRQRKVRINVPCLADRAS